jgi:hypothetical protein
MVGYLPTRSQMPIKATSHIWWAECAVASKILSIIITHSTVSLLTMQDRPDTVPIPSPRTAKENVRELRALRRRVEELQSKLRVSGTAKTSPRSTKSDTYRAMAQSCSSPEIQRRCNGSLAESNSVAAMTSRDQRYQIESAEPVSNSGGTMQSLRGAPCTTPPASPPGHPVVLATYLPIG